MFPADARKLILFTRQHIQLASASLTEEKHLSTTLDSSSEASKYLQQARQNSDKPTSIIPQ